ncbi:MAG: rod shape-determining protein MreC [Xanthomonadales bacterium]|nr:rod shape-determining protein MreC [Xanthomonadales bacterium]
MLYLLLAVALMAMDQRGKLIPRARGLFGTLVEPVFHVVEWPAQAWRRARDYTRGYQALLEENRALGEALLEQAGPVQAQAALEQENRRLRALLEASQGGEYGFRFAELVQVNLDPYSHQVVVDRGQADGVFVGQAVIDGAGIMGQVERVRIHMADVRLISDPDHAIPVQFNRTGLRSVAFGTGQTSTLLLPHVPLQADVRNGDLLVTSGLGERFPAGFPVARVERIERDAGGAFAEVHARPLAALDRGREVLLLFPAAPAAPAPVREAGEQGEGTP